MPALNYPAGSPARALRDALEPVAIGDDLPRVLAELETWGYACINAGAFPRDDFKRAAG
jgi:hypothetical protein